MVVPLLTVCQVSMEHLWNATLAHGMEKKGISGAAHRSTLIPGPLGKAGV